MPDDLALGPVDFLVIEFPDGRVSGEGFDVLLDLAAKDVIRVLDLEFIGRDADGSLRVLTEADLPDDAALRTLAGADSGLIDADDVALLAEEIGEKSACAVVVFESSWTAALAQGLAEAGSALVGVGYVDIDDLQDSLGADA